MRSLPITACIALGVVACSSEPSAPSQGTPTERAGGASGMGGTPGSGGVTLSPAIFQCPPAQDPGVPPPRRLWRLSPSEFSNTVGEFLKGRRAPSSPIQPMPPTLVNPLIPGPSHFRTSAGFQSVSNDEFTQAYGVALEVADQLVQTLKATSCWRTDPSEGCLKTLVQERGAILFRRPVTVDELTQYTGVYASAKLELSADESLSTVLQSMLLAPQFLFKPEIGAEPLGNVVALTPYEVATQLAYAITGASPDQELWDRAVLGALNSPEQIQAQVVRLMASSEAHGARNFVTEYFELRKLLEVQKQLETDTQGMPCPYDRKSIVAQAEALVSDVYASNSTSGFFETLFTSPTVFADCGSEAIFGVTGAPAFGAVPAKFNAPLGQRAGFLTHPAWLGLKAARDETKPMKRGEFIYEEVFCTDIPPVDLNAVPILPNDPNLTMRERFVSHVGLGCSGCHKFIDPTGLALESYDVVGAYRATETPQNKPIDSSGTFPSDASLGDLANIHFTDAVDMSTKLGASNTVKECVMRNAFRYYMGRKETAFDSCSLTSAKEAYDRQAGSYVEFVAKLATSESFMKRSF